MQGGAASSTLSRTTARTSVVVTRGCGEVVEGKGGTSGDRKRFGLVNTQYIHCTEDAL